MVGGRRAPSVSAEWAPSGAVAPPRLRRRSYLLVTPIEDSLLYVQPLYLQSDQTQLPQLKRVIVFCRAPAPADGQGNAQ